MSTAVGSSPALRPQFNDQLCQFQAVFDQKISALRDTLSVRIDELSKQFSDELLRLRQLPDETTNHQMAMQSTVDDDYDGADEDVYVGCSDDDMLYTDHTYYELSEVEENVADAVTATSSNAVAVKASPLLSDVEDCVADAVTATTADVEENATVVCHKNEVVDQPPPGQIDDADADTAANIDDNEWLPSRHSENSSSESDNNHFDNVRTPQPTVKTDKKTVYQCEFCAYMTANRYVFQLHQFAEHDGHRTAFSVCPPMTLTGLHRRPAATLQHYDCDHCERRFYLRAQLRIHMRNHSDDRPHVCDECGCGFKQRGQLNQHKRMHRDQRDHRCGLCERAFRSRTGLTVHMQSHTGERPHECPMCGRGYSKRYHVRKHLRKVHAVTDLDAVFPPTMRRRWWRNGGAMATTTEPAEVKEVNEDMQEEQAVEVEVDYVEVVDETLNGSEADIWQTDYVEAKAAAAAATASGLDNEDLILYTVN